MLVAGYATGPELLSLALAWEPTSVTAFDLSRTSLASAQRMSEQLGVDVEFHHGDLLELGDWNRRFEVIVCTGTRSWGRPSSGVGRGLGRSVDLDRMAQWRDR
ncbi:MAG: class I SAM-dependent methyltransferase [Candidatus Nanopelagicales bacterium]